MSSHTFHRVADGVFRFTSHTNAHAGPHVAILGGIHGNERIGVRVLDALRRSLLLTDPPDARIVRGTITLVYGNEAALRIGKRGSTPHADLNRCFPLNCMDMDASHSDSRDKHRHTGMHGGDGSWLYEHTRARQLAPILQESDVVLDLHATNKPSMPFVRIAGASAALRAKQLAIAQYLPCHMELLDPCFLIGDGQIALTDEFTGAHGGVGVCFESGLASDLSPQTVNTLADSVWRLLTHATRNVESLPRHVVASSTDGETATKTTQRREQYEITKLVKLTDAGFCWADGVGNCNFQKVAANEPIGFLGHDASAPVLRVPYESYLVFPKVKSLWKIGAYVTNEDNAIELDAGL
jgi:predicted deacylase